VGPNIGGIVGGAQEILCPGLEKTHSSGLCGAAVLAPPNLPRSGHDGPSKCPCTWPPTVLALLVNSAVRAEVKEIRFGRQLGLGYLQLLRRRGAQVWLRSTPPRPLGEVKVSYHPIGTPAAINDAFLSGHGGFLARPACRL